MKHGRILQKQQTLLNPESDQISVKTIDVFCSSGGSFQHEFPPRRLRQADADHQRTDQTRRQDVSL